MRSGLRRGRKVKAAGRNSRMLKRFLAIVTSIVGVFVIVAGAAVFAFINPAQANETVTEPFDYTVNSPKPSEEPSETDSSANKGFMNTYLIPPRITTALVIGTDQTDTLSDVNLLVFFNRDTGKVDIVSVPRDLYTTINQDLRSDLEGSGKWVPQAMKITELHSYGQPDMGDEALKRELESEFNLNIDYMVNVSLESFRSIVDIVGPITMEIPDGGLYYYDPDQNLTINVPGGVQELDGKLAEGVVRYRATYQRGDLQRIEVQQEFMKELFSQALNKETLIANAPELLATVIEFVDTDFKLTEGPKYIPYISKLTPELFDTHTLPGQSDYVSNGEQNISYYMYDPVLCTELFDKILYDTTAETEEPLDEDTEDIAEDETDIRDNTVKTENGRNTDLKTGN